MEIDSVGQDTSAKTLIRNLKAHFARYGCPETVVSDNGPLYASAGFATFYKEWDFEHTPSSPSNSQSNGQAESAVKTVRKLLRKAIDTKKDVQLTIRDHRNTPSQSHDMSSAQRLLNRLSRTLLPTAGSLLQPRADTSQQRKSIQLAKEKQAEYFNRSAKDLPSLCEGYKSRIKPFIKGNSEWQKGTVLTLLDERSYEIETDSGGVLRRNRVHLKPTRETSNSYSQDNKIKPDIAADTAPTRDPHPPVPPLPQAATEISGPKETPVPTPRPKRIVQPPARF